jgi:hypothetical protein
MVGWRSGKNREVEVSRISDVVAFYVLKSPVRA